MSKTKKRRQKKSGQKKWSGFACPFCKDKRTVKLSEHMFCCHNCDAYFDDEPDEGGDYCSDPTRRMMREEERDRRARR